MGFKVDQVLAADIARLWWHFRLCGDDSSSYLTVPRFSFTTVVITLTTDWLSLCHLLWLPLPYEICLHLFLLLSYGLCPYSVIFWVPASFFQLFPRRRAHMRPPREQATFSLWEHYGFFVRPLQALLVFQKGTGVVTATPPPPLTQTSNLPILSPSFYLLPTCMPSSFKHENSLQPVHCAQSSLLITYSTLRVCQGAW